MPVEDLCDKVFFLLIAELMSVNGCGREVGVSGYSSFFTEARLNLPSPRENISVPESFTLICV